MPLTPEQYEQGLIGGRHLIYAAINILRGMGMRPSHQTMTEALSITMRWFSQVDHWREVTLIKVEDLDDEYNEYVEINETLIYLGEQLRAEFSL